MTNALTLAIPFPSATGSPDTYIQAVNRFPLLTQEQETALARRLRDDRRRGSGAPAGAVAPARGGVDRARLSGLRIAACRSDPGRQRRTDEGGQALRSGPRRAAGVLRGALDPRRNPRIHPEELAHRQSRDHQGAAQVVLQPAQPEARPFDHDAGRGRAAWPRQLNVKPEDVVEMETRMGGHDVALEPSARTTKTVSRRSPIWPIRRTSPAGARTRADRARPQPRAGTAR